MNNDFKRRFIEQKREDYKNSSNSYYDNNFYNMMYVYLNEEQLRLANKILNSKKMELFIICLICIPMCTLLLLFGDGDDVVGKIFAYLIIIGTMFVLIKQTIRVFKLKIPDNIKCYRGVVLSKQIRLNSRKSGSHSAVDIRLDNGKIVFGVLSKKVSKKIKENDQVLIIPFDGKRIIIPYVIE